MKVLCKECMHKLICKHSEAYYELMSSLDINVAVPFNINIDCAYYSKPAQTYYTLLNDVNSTGHAPLTEYLSGQSLTITGDDYGRAVQLSATKIGNTLVDGTFETKEEDLNDTF